MRIVFVARAYWPAIGGVEGFVRQLARALAERHEVTVLAQRADAGESNRLTDSLDPPPPFEAFSDGGVRVEQIRVPPARLALLAPLAYQAQPGLRGSASGANRPPSPSESHRWCGATRTVAIGSQPRTSMRAWSGRC